MVTRRAGGDRRPVIGAAAVSVSTAVVLVAAVGGAWTVWNPGLLKGPAVMDGSARGTALVLVAVALPALVVSMLLAVRGVHRAVITWLSALLFVAYNSVLLLFMTPFNAAFLVYVAMLSTSAWALWTLVSAVHVEELGGRFAPTAPAKAVAWYVWVVVALNATAWLRQVVPALTTSGTPAFLEGTGASTSALYAQDLALWLPLLAVAAWWLHQGVARGYVVVTALLGTLVIESISVAVDQWWGHRADPVSAVASADVVLPFLGLAVVGLIPVVLMLRRFDESPDRPDRRTTARPHAGTPSGRRDE